MPRRSLFGRVPHSFALALLIVCGFGLPILEAWHHVAWADEASAAKPAPLVVASVFREYAPAAADRWRSFAGIFALVGICWAFSRNRRAIDWRMVAIGLGMQGVLAVFLLRVQAGQTLFDAANQSVVKLLDYSKEGSKFLFASYATGQVEPAVTNFAFEVLPSIVFFSSLMAVLYHLGVMQVVIRGISWVMQRSLRTSGAETLSTAANIFVGQTEAPLLVRPFVATMTKSELLVIMAGGMANTAGGVLVVYSGMLHRFFEGIAGHLLVESILSAPAAIVTSKMLWPEDGVPTTRGETKMEVAKVDANSIEAAARGASEGLSLAFNVAAMLIAFIAIISMLDGGLGWLTSHLIHRTITFQDAAGWAFTPFAWLMGTPWEDCVAVGRLLGQKIVLNEFVAYGSLAKSLQEQHGFISERAFLIASYALNGFANFGSIAILIGGIGAMAPQRRSDIAALGFLALFSGSLATFMTACFAGALV